MVRRRRRRTTTRKQKLGREVWDLGDRMVKAEARRGVEGHYFAARGIGVYSPGRRGSLRRWARGWRAKFNERLDKAIEIDPHF